MFYSSPTPLTPCWDINCSKKRDFWANYNVKPSSSKIENFIKLYRSQIWPKKVVRMLVLSMKNNFEYLFTISRFADPLGRWPEHADYGSEFAPICDWLWEQRDFLVFDDFDDVLVFSRAGCGWQKLFRAYCGYNGCTLGHFQSTLMPLGRLGGLSRG